MSKPAPPKILVAMPAYNEAKYIGSMALRARQYADMVLVVDDGSTDGTSEIARLAGATVIRHEQNKGKGAAIQSILAEAKNIAPDILVLLDADSQHNPQEIPRLIQPILEGFDLVIGSRKLQRSNIPLYRRIGQKVLLHSTQIVSRKRLTDSESGFRAFSPRAIAELKLSENGFAVESEMIIAAAEKGLKITEVPISAIYTEDGSTLNPVTHGSGVLNRILVLISEKRPLLFFGFFGGIFLAFGIAAALIVIWVYYFVAPVLATGTALISVLFITAGLSCISTGIILDVLVRRLDKRL